MENKENKIGVVLMTYGSAITAEHVSEYMAHIYRGKVPEGTVADFEKRYRLVGYSPLVEITEKQAELLEKFLNGDRYVVRAGMLHSHPFIEEAVRDLRNEGATRCFGIILSPQFSSFIMDGYRAALEAAALQGGFSKDAVAVADPWPMEPHFIDLLAGRVRAAIEKLRNEGAKSEPFIVFTTHSLPRRVVERDPSYLEQLAATTAAVVKKLNKPEILWKSAYQSAGHTPEEWLKPDLTDVLSELRELHTPSVLIVPIQFLADHLEILYDLDIAARKQCEGFGIAYNRIELPNVDPLFIEALAGLVKSRS